MKKFLGILGACLLLLVPTIFLAGCKNDDSAESVVNRTYYVTKVMKDNQNITTSATNGNMRINFGTNYFKVEISQEGNSTSYGFYTGTYSIDENEIILNINSYGGIWSDASTNTVKKAYVLKKLTYNKGKLFTEFINNNDILQYTLELPN